MTPSKFIQLKADLKSVIDEEEDFVCIIKLLNGNVFGEEVLGKGDVDTGETLILWFTRRKMCSEVKNDVFIRKILFYRAKMEKRSAPGKNTKKVW